jgi:hypothetical protein
MWFDGIRQPDTLYVASVSRGKDSTAMLRAIQLMGWPLDMICAVDIWATPKNDYAVITQSIGRIARTFEGKKDAICYDFVDNIGYLVKSYKKRCTSYRKARCYFVDNS